MDCFASLAMTEAWLLRRRGTRPPDIAGRVAEALHHHSRQILGFVRHAGAGAHGVAVLMPKLRRRVALLPSAGAIHHPFAAMPNVQVRRAQMLAGGGGD